MNKDEGPSRATTPTDLIQRLGGDWFSSSGLCSFFLSKKMLTVKFFLHHRQVPGQCAGIDFRAPWLDRIGESETRPAGMKRHHRQRPMVEENLRQESNCIHQIVIIETTSTLHFISAWFSIPVDSWDFIFLCVVPTDAIQIFAMARSGAIPRLRRARGFQQQLGSVLSGDVHEIQRIFKGKLLPRYQPPSLFPACDPNS